MCIVPCFVGFWGSVFCWKCITWLVFALFGKCFFCNLFWGVFLGDGMKGFEVLWSVDVVMSGVGR